ncbi:MAG TPA: anhydro-N-acetylmuramic acid kinase [Pseudomonadales bacterium]|nr:anhydro-N-acetylmuramic acid kinase [Pseudomonadales bacterium]
MSRKSAEIYIGLMSGTSLDAIDAALIDIRAGQSPILIHAYNHSIPAAVRSEIELMCQPGADEINRMGSLDRRMGELFAEAVLILIQQANIQATQVRAIGCHGQTIRHHPDKSTPFTVQIGDPNTIAFRTGITTVADFRRMDIAAGGQAAPLVPAFHDAVLRDASENRVIINVGGMANITTLAKNIPVTGFDTGPGNILIDSWIQKKRQLPYDESGSWAASGQCNIVLLDQLLSHPYIQAPAPKSTGRETFHLAWLESVLTAFSSISDVDIQRTLLEFTAHSIALAISNLPVKIDRALLCGGGSHNSLLRERISTLLMNIKTGSTSDVGIEADWMEAMAFAWLAKQRMENKPGNVPAVTGASRLCILGGVYSPG